MKKDWKAVANEINARMGVLAISQVDLATRARVSIATLRQIQHAVPKDRNPRTLAAISEALGMPSHHLEEVAEGRTPASGPDRFTRLESELAELRDRVADLERQIRPRHAG